MIERTIHTAVVTGPTGVLGPAVCDALLDAGCTVYAVCRPGSQRAAAVPAHPRLHRIECDLAEIASLPGMIPDRVDAFFHLAWAFTAGPRRVDMPSQIDNIHAVIAAIRTAAAMGCKVFVGSGSQAEYGPCDAPLRADTPAFPDTPYGMAKLCAGQMGRLEAERLGLDFIWPRILSVYGPYDSKRVMTISVIHQLLEGKCPALTMGEQMWDFLYAADAGEALYLLARHGRSGAVYPVGSGDARPLREYIFALRDAIDPSLPLGFGQIPYGARPIMFLQADIRALQNDTGFRPHTGFDEGIRKTIEWVKKEYHVTD